MNHGFHRLDASVRGMGERGVFFFLTSYSGFMSVLHRQLLLEGVFGVPVIAVDVLGLQASSHCKRVGELLGISYCWSMPNLGVMRPQLFQVISIFREKLPYVFCSFSSNYILELGFFEICRIFSVRFPSFSFQHIGLDSCVE